jgi:hypothetical protein
VVGYISFGAVTMLHAGLLKIHGKGNMRHRAISQGRAAGQIHNIFDVGGSHNPFVVLRHINKELVECDILLRVGANQVVKLKTGDGQNRSAIELGVIESVEEMLRRGLALLALAPPLKKLFRDRCGTESFKVCYMHNLIGGSLDMP